MAGADQLTSHDGDDSHGYPHAELMPAARLAEVAKALGASQRWTAASQKSTPLLALVDDAARQLADDNAELSRGVRETASASLAEEWLLDNYYLIEEQVLLVRTDLPEHYGIELPRLTEGPNAGMPRTYEAMLSLIAHTDARIDSEYLLRFVTGYQESAPLTIGEGWAIPIMLRVGLIENLRHLSASVVATERAERHAESWAARLLEATQDHPEQVADLVAELDREPEPPTAFYLRLAQRVATFESGTAAVDAWLADRLRSRSISLERESIAHQQHLAADQISIANSITGIRFLDAYEWRVFFERISGVEAVLRQDPAATYARMDFNSRDRYRHAVELTAQRSDVTEIELAEKALELARASQLEGSGLELAAHVGYWLIGEGRLHLEQVVGYRPTPQQFLYRRFLRRRGVYYATLFVLALGVLLALVGWYGRVAGQTPWQMVITLLLVAGPLGEVAITILNRVSARVFPPKPLPKFNFERPIPDEYRTVVVVPALITSADSARELIEHLEIAYLANRDPNLGFGIVGDLRAGPEEVSAKDAEILEAARYGIAELNDRYQGEDGVEPFHLLIRSRRFTASEGVWMGWERKRGALVELVRHMRDKGASSFTARVGDTAFLRSCTFVITLDTDTVLPRDGARRLVATIAHPLNRAVWQPGDARVYGGYGLIQPGVGMTLTGAAKSRFASLYSGRSGIDPYAQAVSDTYQDVFGEGSFTGKGIFEVDIFHGVLEGLFPENTLLSHDLIEGSFLRTGLASDVEVLDDYPTNYLASVGRNHRWMRGDWQTLPYLFGRIRRADGSWAPNPLSGLHRWKILDNLRRSLVMPSTLFLFTLGWLLFPGPALAWPLILVAVTLFPAFCSFACGLFARSGGIPFSDRFPSLRTDFRDDLERLLLNLATLPHQASQSADAILRAVWRRFVSHRGLLEWETASDAETRAGTTRRAFWSAMGTTVATAIVALAVGSRGEAGRLVVAMPLVLLWLAGPTFAWKLSTLIPIREPIQLTEQQRLTARRIARKTWRFYERFATEEGHHLAPDNFQEDPGAVIAWRTSPTNLGLQLLASLTAYDLGFITLGQVVERTSETLTSMAGLERFRGHFYNWYDIRTLQPLRPAYVSTVDSGNLMGHLLALRTGLLGASESPIIGGQFVRGLRDTVSLALEDLVVYGSALESQPDVRLLKESLDQMIAVLSVTSADNVGQWSELLADLKRMTAENNRYLARACGDLPEDTEPPEEPTEDSDAAACVRMTLSVNAVTASVSRAAELLDEVAPWAALITAAPADVRVHPQLAPIFAYVPSLTGLAQGLDVVIADLKGLAAGDAGAASWASEVLAGILEGRERASFLLARLRLDCDIVQEMWDNTDFAMLYDQSRHLFSVGYNLSEGALDRSFYDLLASECRLASFLAIAKSDVPQEHWFRLGRSLTRTPQGRTLVSWSASMFEYLMPLLVMRDYPGTLLHETYESVVARQIAYGKERGVPWGVSEAAFNAKDADLTYQYQAFGVPGLGLKRGLSDDVVVAPYASLLALPVAPEAVLSNMDALTAEGAEGRYGYYESLDYTPGRVPAGRTRAVVKSYFAHHQGMSLLAIGNVLCGDIMQKRFHDDAVVASAGLLLQERLPRQVRLMTPHVQEVTEATSVRELPESISRTYDTPHTPAPTTHFLSNGRYAVMITNSGGGYSRFEDMAVSRYREDITRDCWGTFFYLRDLDTGNVISVPYNPIPSSPDSYKVTFFPDKAEYRRVDGDIETVIEVAVSPEDDIEVRRIALTNKGMTVRHLEITSYFEIGLSSQAADRAHRAFSNLFVETEAIPRRSAILFSRRPRTAEEQRLWGVHVAACDQSDGGWSFETDRAAFLGRLHTVVSPVAMRVSGDLGRSEGAVLDPCASLRRALDIPPGETVRVVFSTGVAHTRNDAIFLAEKYHDIRTAQRAIDLAWAAARVDLRDLGVSPAGAVALDRLASRMLLMDPYSPLKVKTPVENGLQMNGLWSLGISGDLPIIVVRVDDLEHTPLVRQALLAHQYWRHRGLVCDLVIVNTRPTGYADDLDERLRQLVRTGHALQMLDRPGGVYVRRTDQMSGEILNLLLTVARVTLDGSEGSLRLQLNRRATRPAEPPALVPTASPIADPPRPFIRPRLEFDNGLGGFDPQAGDYVIVLEDGQATPTSWIDVLANPTFGCTVSEAGIGCTWALNSHENRLTTWNNDPVTDGTGEMLYIRDEETGEYWSPTAAPVRTPEPYVIRHGRGRVRFEHDTHGILHTLDWFVPHDEPVRVCRLTLENHTDRPRRLSVTQLVEWVLGDSRSRAQQLVVTWFDVEADMLTAHNHFNMDFPGRSAFLAADRPVRSWTASRTEFLGRNGSPVAPAAMRHADLGRASGRFHDNCGALRCEVTISPGDSEQITFLLGQTDTLDQARELVKRLRTPQQVESSLGETLAMWEDLVTTVQVSTPDPALDTMLNGPLLYQVTACRLWGRTATYQSSGAMGFRDQLQDVRALLVARPNLVRSQILEASRRQFAEGDVLHWWQPYSGRGVRTHFKDDRHWLPLLVAEYIHTTGDASVLDEVTPFIEGADLPPEQEDAYLQPAISETGADVYEHCIRAIETGRPTGMHGLPLMGGGDWNDGMNHVGIAGKGESVWLAWFLGHVLLQFAPICELRGEMDRAEEYRAWAQRLGKAAEDHGWDGAWYRRAFFDDGTPLGTHEARECRIDAIAQAWAAISGLGDPDRVREALASVDEHLVRRDDGLIALLTPPFDTMKQDPGYIKGYVPGVRENGGQYTHAAVWTVLAQATVGDGDRAHALLSLINPINHGRTPEDVAKYKVEPYVVAADVYAVHPHTGRGGWTWYTGAASWFYSVALGDLLGMRIVANETGRFLRIEPCIPREWAHFELTYRHGSAIYHVRVENPKRAMTGVESVTLDGRKLAVGHVPLVDDGENHEVLVTMGERAPIQ